MPKEKQKKKGTQLRHTPLGIEDVNHGLKRLKPKKERDSDDDEIGEIETIEATGKMGTQIFSQARDQRMEMAFSDSKAVSNNFQALGSDSDYDVGNTFALC
jgi:hypothetical protein